MKTFEQFLAEAEQYATKAEQKRAKDSFNHKVAMYVRKEMGAYEDAYREAYQEEKELSVDKVDNFYDFDEKKHYHPTKEYQALLNVAITPEYKDFKKMRKALPLLKNKYPKLVELATEFMDKFQEEGDSIYSSTVVPRMSSAEKKEVKYKQALSATKYNEEVEKIVETMAKEMYKTLKAQYGSEFKNTEKEIEEHIKGLRLDISEKLGDFEVAEVKEQYVTINDGQANGVWHIFSTDGTKKILTVWTSQAGGYNIQKLHIRTKVTVK